MVEISQIAGRAGRFKNDGGFGTTGDCENLNSDEIEKIEQHNLPDTKMLYWRNSKLNFDSSEKLISSLELKPTNKNLIKSNESTDEGVLRYLLKRKNINVVLTIELIFIILASFIVFTSQPLNWIVALIMFTHLIGVGWLISNPDSYYTMVDTNSTDMDSLETASAMIIFGYGVFVYSSRFFLG